VTIVNRDVSRRARAARVMRSQAVGWFVLVMYALSLYLCGAATDHYNSYAVQFDDDCGRLVPTPLGIAVVLWLALALAGACVPLAVGWSCHRRQARGLPWFRGIGFALTCLGVLITAWRLFCAWGQTVPFHVSCPPPGP
jgi:hypothetical protein